MKPFTIAFPLPVSKEDAPRLFLEKLNLDIGKEAGDVSRILDFFEPILQGAVAGLEAIFAEHLALSAEESAAIAAHRSLFFLQFHVKTDADAESFLNVAKKILDAEPWASMSKIRDAPGAETPSKTCSSAMSLSKRSSTLSKLPTRYFPWEWNPLTLRIFALRQK